LESDIDHHSSLKYSASRIESGYRTFCNSNGGEIAHHEPFENPIHLSIASLDLSDHVVASETPLELFESRLSSALRQSGGHSPEFTANEKKINKGVSDDARGFATIGAPFEFIYDADKILGKRPFIA